MRSIQAVVFDIGGVLEIGTERRVFQEWEKKLSLEPGDIEHSLKDVWQNGSLGKISLDEVKAKVSAHLNLNESSYAQFMDEVWEEYLGSFNQELADYLVSLRSKYKTALLSNSFVGAREIEEDRNQLSRLCDFIVYSHEVGVAKPNQEIYLLTCEKLKLAPNEVVFLDDKQDFVDGAKNVGMAAVLFRSNAQAIKEINAQLEPN